MATLKLLHSNVDAGRSISYWVGASAFFEVAKPFRATEMTFCLALYDNEPRCGAWSAGGASTESDKYTGIRGKRSSKKMEISVLVPGTIVRRPTL